MLSRRMSSLGVSERIWRGGERSSFVCGFLKDRNVIHLVTILRKATEIHLLIITNTFQVTLDFVYARLKPDVFNRFVPMWAHIFILTPSFPEYNMYSNFVSTPQSLNLAFSNCALEYSGSS